MNKLHLVSLALILGLLGCVAFGVYAVSNIFTIPFTGTVPPDTVTILTMTVGGAPYVQGTTNIDWGSTLVVGTYTKAITVTNPRNTAVAIPFVCTGLPAGITLACSLPASVPAFGTVSGTLTLTISASAVATTFSGTVTIG